MIPGIAPRRWLAGASAAVALGGTLLTAGIAGAQTAPTPDVAFACKGSVAAGAATSGAVTAAVAAKPIATISREEIAARLAQALGKTQAEVERAMAQVEREQPEPPAISVIAIPDPNDTAMMVRVAQRLGVSAGDLAEAIRTAIPPCDAGGSTGGTATIVAIKEGAAGGILQTIADELGGGVTAAQVKAAFEVERPQGVAGVKVQSLAIGNLEALAQALGVTVEQLKAALDSILPKPPVQRP